MNKTTLITALVGGLLIGSQATAQGGMGGGGGGQRTPLPEFTTLDADSDGYVTSEELSEVAGDNASNIMGRMDSDSDGMISAEEFANRPARGEGGGRQQ